MTETVPISVVIPIGPGPNAAKYFREAIQSIEGQTLRPQLVVIVDDMADPIYQKDLDGVPIRVVRNWWRMGVAASFNIGVAAANSECVLMMGADDTLEESCLENCWNVYKDDTHKDSTYYWLGVHYSDGRGDQFLACNAAMVTKSLWRLTGGFPVEAGSGACDAALISLMMVHPELFHFVGVNGNKPLYNYRVHGETDTSQRGSWQGVILETRSLLTELWQRPEWGRFK